MKTSKGGKISPTSSLDNQQKSPLLDSGLSSSGLRSSRELSSIRRPSATSADASNTTSSRHHSLTDSCSKLFRSNGEDENNFSLLKTTIIRLLIVTNVCALILAIFAILANYQLVYRLNILEHKIEQYDRIIMGTEFTGAQLEQILIKLEPSLKQVSLQQVQSNITHQQFQPFFISSHFSFPPPPSLYTRVITTKFLKRCPP